MPNIGGKLFVAALLALCAGLHILEVSGRWDQTFQDANDEAGIVAIVFCVGAALLAASTLLNPFPPSRITGFVCATSILFR